MIDAAALYQYISRDGVAAVHNGGQCKPPIDCRRQCDDECVMSVCTTLIHQVHWAVFYRLTAVPFVHVVTSFECFGKFAGFSPYFGVGDSWLVGLELD